MGKGKAGRVACEVVSVLLILAGDSRVPADEEDGQKMNILKQRLWE